MYIFQVISWKFSYDDPVKATPELTEKIDTLSNALDRMKKFVDRHTDAYISEGTSPKGEFEVTTADETLTACIFWHPDNCGGEV